MGMSHTSTSLWNQLYDQNHIESPRFSLCYVKHPVPHFDGSHAGSLIFGGTDKRLHEAPMVYTPFDPSSRFYEVTIRRVYINPGGGRYLTGPNKDIHLSKTTTKPVIVDEEKMNKGGPIIDSGTTCVCKYIIFFYPFSSYIMSLCSIFIFLHLISHPFLLYNLKQ